MRKDSSFLPLRFSLNEWTGAFGDLGVLIPIYLSLVVFCGIPPAQSLFLVGLLYIISALIFRLSIPVQPLKAMAAIAIAQNIPFPLLRAGGFYIGIILLVLYLTKAIERIKRYFTKPIIRGIQFGVGLMLIQASFKLIFHVAPNQSLNLIAPANDIPSLYQFISVLWILVLPQLPLTLGNAVFAVSETAKDYFGKNAQRAKPENFTLSIAFSNIIIGLLGGMPVCHGSGGMTAHYRFGARTAGSTIITGSLCILLSLLFPDNIFHLLKLIPKWMFAILLLYTGICHAYLIKSLNQKRGLAILMGMAGLLTENLSYALLLGLCFEAAYAFNQRVIEH